MANGRAWGEDVTLEPGWGQAGRAALNAIAAPETWVPAAGALAFQIGHADRNLADWAARKTPVFGSQERADRASYELRGAAGAIWVTSAVAAPSGDDPEGWSSAKAKGLGAQTGAGFLTRETVGFLKDSTNRTRPNGGGWSFPSAHATETAFYATLASRNIETLQWSSTATTASQVGLGALSGLTAWSRLEADQHFPSDVLAGIALGHFLGTFFTDAFFGLDNPRNAAVVVESSRHGAFAGIRFDF